MGVISAKATCGTCGCQVTDTFACLVLGLIYATLVYYSDILLMSVNNYGNTKHAILNITTELSQFKVHVII